MCICTCANLTRILYINSKCDEIMHTAHVFTAFIDDHEMIGTVRSSIVSMRKLTSDYQMANMIPRESRRVVIGPRHFNARQTTIDSMQHIQYKSARALLYYFICGVAINFHPHQIQFNWLGEWHWQSKNEHCQTQEKQFTTSEWKDLFVRVHFLAFDSCVCVPFHFGFFFVLIEFSLE